MRKNALEVNQKIEKNINRILAENNQDLRISNQKNFKKDVNVRIFLKKSFDNFFFCC